MNYHFHCGYTPASNEMRMRPRGQFCCPWAYMLFVWRSCDEAEYADLVIGLN